MGDQSMWAFSETAPLREQKISELSFEHVQRTMQAAGFVAWRFGEPSLKVLYCRRSQQLFFRLRKGRVEIFTFTRRSFNLAKNADGGKPLIEKCFGVICEQRR